MLNSKRAHRIGLLMGTGFVLAIQGCSSSQPHVSHGEQFAPPDTEYATQKLTQTQESAGAHADPTLYPQHFDGPGLSTLGMAKIDLMLQDSHVTNPLTIYVAIADDSQADLRRHAIIDYVVHHSSLKADQISLQPGSSADTYYLAGPNIKNYDKTDTGTDTASSQGYGASSSAGH